MGLFVSRRNKPAGTTAGGAETGADAGGLRGTAGWQPATAGLFAQSGREPGGVGRIAARPVSPGRGRQKPAADHHRRVRRIGGRLTDGLPPRPASTLLGAQDAKHFGEGAEAGLRRVKEEAQAIYLAESLRQAR